MVVAAGNVKVSVEASIRVVIPNADTSVAVLLPLDADVIYFHVPSRLVDSGELGTLNCNE